MCYCMSKKHNQSFIENKFRQRNCELLDKYQGKDKPMKFRCRCGKNSTIRYTSFRRGSYCLGCSGKKKHTLSEVKTEFEKEGYELLSKEYKNALTKMNLLCPVGHKWRSSWNCFQQGNRCKKCGFDKTKEALKLNCEEIKIKFKEAGCELLDNYINNHQKVKYKCSCGKISNITYANFSQGVRCKECAIVKMSGPNHPNWIKNREEAKLRKLVTTKCFSALRTTLNKTNQQKNGKSFKLLGYGTKDLLEHLRNHPNWHLVKSGNWHLDHIFPIKAFLDYRITDLSLINSLDNLQPLTKKDNMKKNAKYDKEKFEKWLKAKGIN